jgi:hypothetical protein
MRHALPAILLTAALGCGSHPAADPSGATGHPAGGSTAAGSFAGCTAVFTAVLGWNISCDGTSVVTREGDDLEALLRGARESMRGAFAGPIEEHRDDVLVAGVPRKGMQLALRTAKKQLVAVGTAAVLQADGGPLRLVACLAGADDTSQSRCKQQVDELSSLAYTDMPPAGVSIRPRPLPAIAGRPVTEPTDCHLAANDHAGILDCGDMVLGWSEPNDPHAIPSERDATIDDTTRKVQAESPAAQPPKRTSVACRIEGAPATCSVIRWPDQTLTIGTAVARGHSILAWCSARDGSTSTICRDSVDTGSHPQPAVPPSPIHVR